MSLPTTVRLYADRRSEYLLSSIPVDLNALAWLEDYLQTWPGTILVVYVPFFA